VSDSRNGSPRKATNAELVLEALLDADVDRGLLREEIAQRTELARATVTNTVATLRDQHGVLSDRRRRKPDYVRVRADAGYVVGVSLAHTRVTCGIADLWGNLLYQPQSERRKVDEQPHPSLDLAADLIRKSLDDIDASKVIGIGIAVAAPVVPGKGLIRESLGGPWPASMKEWLTIDPLKEVKQRLRDVKSLRCGYVLGNAGNLGALPEYMTAAADWDDDDELQDMIYVAWGDGLHAGLVLGGDVYCGAGLAGEIGHISVPGQPPTGAECDRCGRDDCLELVISKNAIQDRIGRELKGIDFDEEPKANTPAIRELKAAARNLGLVLGPLLTVINPQAVVIGGPSEKCYPVIIPEIHSGIRESGILPAFKDVRIRLGEHGPLAPLKGAMLEALRTQRLRYLLSLEHGKRPAARERALA
jgi:predicted NBD/HSP70 family sugar kinase